MSKDNYIVNINKREFIESSSEEEPYGSDHYIWHINVVDYGTQGSKKNLLLNTSFTLSDGQELIYYNTETQIETIIEAMQEYLKELSKAKKLIPEDN